MVKAIICETAYQMFNALNIAINDEDNIYDFYVGTYHKELLKYSENISMILNIRNVFYFDSSSKQKHRFKHKIQRIIDYFFPRLSLRILTEDYRNVKKLKYDVVLIATPNPYMVNFLFYHRESIVNFFEDGTGSYHGKIGENISTPISKFCEKILKRGPSLVTPQEIYLYNPYISNNTYDAIIKKFYPYNYNEDKEKIHIIEKVFCINDKTVYKNFNYIYLGQIYNIDRYSIIENKILDLMNRLSCNAIIRPHPDSNYSKYSEMFPIDSGMNQWEIICGSQINSQHILIGTYSTAQLIPKNIFDREPYVIFTFFLYAECFSIAQRDEISLNIKKFTDSYTHKEKIYVPQSISELKRIIEYLNNYSN